MTLQNEKFEELISDQLSRQLEPQRGRATAAFRAHIAADRAAVAGGSADKRDWARRKISAAGSFFWIALPSAVAAALAVAMTLHFLPAGTPPRDQPIATRIPGPLDHTGGSGDGLSSGDAQLVAVTGVIQDNPGDIRILPPPRTVDNRSQVRTADYIEPAGPYPLNMPPLRP